MLPHNPTFMHRLLSHNSRRKRKRPASAGRESQTVAPGASGDSAVAMRTSIPQKSSLVRRSHENNQGSGFDETSRKLVLKRRRLRQIEYYKRCYHDDLDSDGVGRIIRRPTDVDTQIGTNKENSTPLAPSSSLARKQAPESALSMNADTWQRSIPFLILLVPLHVQWDSVMNNNPTYDDLVRQTTELRKERDQVQHDYAVLKDRYLRFVKHVRAVEEERQQTSTLPNTHSGSEIQKQPQDSASIQQPVLHPSEKPKTLPTLKTADPRRRVTISPLQNGPRHSRSTSPQHEPELTFHKLSPSRCNSMGQQALSQRSENTIASSRPGNETCSKESPKKLASSAKRDSMKGWISNHCAREFVIDSHSTKPGSGADGEKMGVSSLDIQSDSKSLQNQIVNLCGSSELSSPMHQFGPYCEVVRERAQRQKLKPHDCEECSRFIDAILENDRDGVYKRADLMCASRHRHRFTPPSTPPEFWELSFIDEKTREQN